MIGLLMHGPAISQKLRMRRLVVIMNAIQVVLAATKHMATIITLVRVKRTFCPDLYSKYSRGGERNGMVRIHQITQL